MSESFDKQLNMADVYAVALFAIAREANKIAETRSELEELAKLEVENAEFSGFMASHAIDDDQRAAGLEKMFRGRLSDMVLNTLLVMNRNRRHGLLKALLRCFVVHLEAAAGEIEIRVTSAAPLDDAEKRGVVEVAAQLSGQKPVASFHVDTEIIGGLILQLGDIRYDNSVRRQLAAAAARLHERSERGLGIKVGD